MAQINLQARQKAERHVLRAIKDLDHHTAAKLLRSLADDLSPNEPPAAEGSPDMSRFLNQGNATTPSRTTW